MKSIKLSDYFSIVKPQYVYLKLTPNNSIRNQSSHKLAKTFASMFRNVFQMIKRDEKKLVKVLGRKFMVGTKYSLQQVAKVSYFIYMERSKVEFYFIVPSQYLTVIKEKMGDVWRNVTIDEVSDIPTFSDSATKYQLVYKKEDALSLATNRTNNELLNSNLNVVDVLEQGDKVGIFYNFVPITQFGWAGEYRHTLNKLKAKMPVDRDKTGINYLLKQAFSFVYSLVDGFFVGLGDKKDDSHALLGKIETVLDRMNGGSQVGPSTARKASATIIGTQIAILSESPDELKQWNNAQSLVNSYQAIADDNELVAKPLRKKFDPLQYNIGAQINKVGDEEAQNFLSLPGRELLEAHNCIEKIETQEIQIPEDLREGVVNIGVNTYRGTKQEAYLSNDKEFKNLATVLIGPNGAGKSTLLGNMAHDMIKAGECVFIFDFIRNCELSAEVAATFPHEKVLNINCDDFSRIQGLGYNEIRQSDDPFVHWRNAKVQSTLLQTLVNSINADDMRLSSKMQRYLTSASLAVFLQGGSIKDVFQVLQNHEVRRRYLQGVPKDQAERIEEYVGYLHELDEYSTSKIKEGNKTLEVTQLSGTKDHLITGIIDRLTKLKVNTFMELMLNETTANNIDLVSEMQKNQLICLKMPETMFPTDAERDLYTTYWLTKIWCAMQIRSELIPDREQLTKCNLIIDELYQVRNTERFLTEILSRLRKFALKPIISCHYLNQIHQIREELRSASPSYMLISGCDKQNFKELKEELYPFELEDLLELPRHHSMNLIKCKQGYARFITKLPLPVTALTKNLTKDLHNVNEACI
jgi:energy-coupling factor transporter ATP-binding protein EcfA2